jgi:WhiB family redox-sensing transcriptional regulator
MTTLNHGCDTIAHDPGLGRAGTRDAYNNRCRCQPCTDANNAYFRERRRQRRAQKPLVPKEPALRYLEKLLRSGLSLRVISARSGVARSTLGRIRNSPRVRLIEEWTEQRILRVACREVFPRSKVPSGPTAARVARLVAAGWPESWIAREIGSGGNRVVRDRNVRVEKAERVRALHDLLLEPVSDEALKRERLFGVLFPAATDRSWMERKACASLGVDLFYTETPAAHAQAKRTCASCPVHGECLEYALTMSEPDGVWGGMTARERRRIARERKAGSAA